MKEKINQVKVFISVTELADRWAISSSAVYQNKCLTDQLKRYRFGKSVKFSLEEVVAFEQKLQRA